jgi:hypothetical protein
MKKITMSILTACLLLVSMPILQAGVENNPASKNTSKTVSPAEEKILLSRLDEIKEIDKSKLSSPEKKQLRQEVRGIKKQLDHGGIYISVGAVIIILLLIIILL